MLDDEVNVSLFLSAKRSVQFEKFEAQQSSFILDLCFRKTRAKNPNGYRDVINFEKLNFQNVYSKTQSQRFQIPPCDWVGSLGFQVLRTQLESGKTMFSTLQLSPCVNVSNASRLCQMIHDKGFVSCTLLYNLFLSLTELLNEDLHFHKLENICIDHSCWLRFTGFCKWSSEVVWKGRRKT